MNKILLCLLVLVAGFTQAKLVVSDEIVLFSVDPDKAPQIYDCKNKNSCIFLDGEIQEGDFEDIKLSLLAKLRSYYRESHQIFTENINYTFTNHENFDLSQINNRLPTFKIFINSSGGNLIEAIKLAHFVREFELSVFIPMEKQCISACFFVYSGAVNRLASQKSSLGIHTPYFEKEFFKGLTQKQADELYAKEVKNAYKQLEVFNIPSRFVEIMKKTPSDQIYSLNINDQLDIMLDPIWRERLLANLDNLDYEAALKTGGAQTVAQEFQLRVIDEYFPGLVEQETLGQVISENAVAQSMLTAVILKTNVDPRELTYDEMMVELANNHPGAFQVFQETTTPWHTKLNTLRNIQMILSSPKSIESTGMPKMNILSIIFLDVL